MQGCVGLATCLDAHVCATAVRMIAGLTAAPAYPTLTLQVLLATLEREWLLMKRNWSAHTRRSALQSKCCSDVPHIFTYRKETLAIAQTLLHCIWPEAGPVTDGRLLRAASCTSSGRARRSCWRSSCQRCSSAPGCTLTTSSAHSAALR